MRRSVAVLVLMSGLKSEAAGVPVPGPGGLALILGRSNELLLLPGRSLTCGKGGVRATS